jgi:hypothetical protein
MSIGTPIATLRIPREIRSQIDAAIDRSKGCRKEGDYTLTTWIIAAIQEKLRHTERRKKQQEKRKCGTQSLSTETTTSSTPTTNSKILPEQQPPLPCTNSDSNTD